MYTEAITPRLHIPRHALVLEVGSGHRPHPRADVLTDKYLNDVERGGQLVIDRPFVQAEAEQLPFKPNIFDYVICRQVLEHVEEPERFFCEVNRVGHAGYIEAPSVIWEQLHPTRFYHHWYVLKLDDMLLLKRKSSLPTTPSALFGHLFERLNRQSPEYRLLIRQYADLFYVRYQWQGEIKYCVNPKDAEKQAWFRESWNEEKAKYFVASRSQTNQALGLMMGAFESILGGLLRRIYRSRRVTKRHPVELSDLMQCPVCAQQGIEITYGKARCITCNWHTVIRLPD